MELIKHTEEKVMNTKTMSQAVLSLFLTNLIIRWIIDAYNILIIFVVKPETIDLTISTSLSVMVATILGIYAYWKIILDKYKKKYPVIQQILDEEKKASD